MERKVMTNCILCGDAMSITDLILVSKLTLTDLAAPKCLNCIVAQWEVMTA